MPQKSRKEKERAAQRRETQVKAPPAPAPIEMETANPDSGMTLACRVRPTRRPTSAIGIRTAPTRNSI